MPATLSTGRVSNAGSREAELASVRKISACKLLEWAFARRLYAECRDSGMFFRVIDAMQGTYTTKMVAARGFPCEKSSRTGFGRDNIS
jgi:hypothetical protein